MTRVQSVLQGVYEGFEEYAIRLEDIINTIRESKKVPITPTLHQTASSTGRIHTTIQYEEAID